ncbi:MAG TPA: alpha/beta fold hydrolase [Chloroflexia bacterium]|jgi:pimeloyl-ACP methyl ester carboxylesterase
MTKQNLLLLHGALGASEQFAPLMPLLSDRYNVHSLDFEGHGKASLRERPFRMEHFAENIRDYMEQHAIERTHIFGYSMGGYVAVTLASTHPHLVQSIATLGTKYHWDNEIAARETALLDTEKIAAKVPHYARALAERHTAAGWETVVSHTRDLLMHLAEQRGLRAENVAHIQQRVRVMIGDRDSTVSLTESVEIYHALPNGEMEVLPSTPHQFEKVPLGRLAFSLAEFFG